MGSTAAEDESSIRILWQGIEDSSAEWDLGDLVWVHQQFRCQVSSFRLVVASLLVFICLSIVLVGAMSWSAMAWWGIPVGLLWLVTGGAVTLLIRILLKGGASVGSFIGLFLVATLVAIGTALSWWFAWPVIARFNHSRGEFDARRGECEQSRDPYDGPVCGVSESIGSYKVASIWFVDDDLIFSVAGPSFGSGGFVYAADGVPPESSPILESPEYLDLGGGWFSYVASD